MSARFVTIQAGMREKIQVAQSEALKQENIFIENLHGLHQRMEKKEGARADKMYHDLRDMYWWPGMKRDIATYVRSTSDEIDARHGVPMSIISDKDGRFTSRCCQTVQKALETRETNVDHVELGEIKVDKTLCFVEEPVKIMDREVKSLKRIAVIMCLYVMWYAPWLCDQLESFMCMSPPIRRKYHDSVAFATGCKKIKKYRRGNRKIRIPIAMWPCRVKEKMTLKGKL
ncbi:putative reverse transcriptase domain-containing protein [Tanacetum coccineum]